MTILEIQDKMAQLLDANDEMFKNAEAENRDLSKDEKEIAQNNINKVEGYRLMETSKGFTNSKPGARITRDNTPAPKDKFSLMRAVVNVIENKPFDEVTRNLNLMGANEFRKAGKGAEGMITLPFETRADILAGTATAGQEVVAENKMSIIPPLVDKLVFMQAGATFMNGLVGNVSIPSYADTSVAWATEVGGAADGGGAFSEVNLAPKRLTARVDVSKLFLQQDGAGAEQLLLANIANAVARKLEATILSKNTLHADYPSGIGYKLYDTAAVVPDWSTVVGMESAIDAGNALVGNLAFITNAAGRGILKNIVKVANYPEYLVDNDGKVNGYPLLVTNAAPGDVGSAGNLGELLVFGNWADLVIGQWGGYDITVDPYSRAANGQVRLVINAYFDAKGLRGATGASATLDEYAVSFAAAAIKS